MLEVYSKSCLLIFSLEKQAEIKKIKVHNMKVHKEEVTMQVTGPLETRKTKE